MSGVYEGGWAQGGSCPGKWCNRGLAEAPRGSLRIACAPALGLSFMPRVICAFLKHHEQANISLVVQSSTSLHVHLP
ncbi:LysR substrate-binding domain-containing protein [Pseudomonas sp. GCM10022186]|uniref:LysR substrate-binding domain-containing protein n=1 Tax=Pseudomonas sp. GCM10022186 TaxID=3252650 RepID=UPI003605C359